jgi:hypothetical protein
MPNLGQAYQFCAARYSIPIYPIQELTLSSSQGGNNVEASKNLGPRYLDYTAPYPNSNSVALVLERTIQTGRQPLVGEVSANFFWIEGCRMVSAGDPLRP